MSAAHNPKELCLHPHDTANDPVTLHEGPVTLHLGNPSISGTGKLVLRFVPDTGLRFEAEVPSLLHGVGDEITAEIAGATARVTVSSTSMSAKGRSHSSKLSGHVRVFTIGGTEALVAAGFQIVNFPDFFTPGPRPPSPFGSSEVGRIQIGVWLIHFAPTDPSGKMFESLKESGGYGFTHVGNLARIDGSSFTAAEADDLLEVLTRFLSYARGSACGMPVRWGIGSSGSICWQRWGSSVVNPWKTPDNWFEEHHGNLLSEVFPLFYSIATEAELAEPLNLARHWYQVSNMRAGGMEGAIILGLTALDLLAALVVTRDGAQGHAKFDNLPSAKKLRRLLDTMKVPSAIPAKYAELRNFAVAQGWGDAPTALTEIRHGYVHAKKERRTIVLSAPSLATFQAWQLAVWYQELALLHFLGHTGKYRNRVTAEVMGVAETVPWA